MMNYKIIAQEIKILRTSLNLKQEEFGAKVGVTKQAVSAWEAGLYMPKIETLSEIDELFGTSIMEIYTKMKIYEKGNSKCNITYVLPKLNLIHSIDELDEIIDHLINSIEIDLVFSISITKMLKMILKFICGYVLFYHHVSKIDGEDWSSVAYYLENLRNENEPYPLDYIDFTQDLAKQKIIEMISRQQFELSENFDYSSTKHRMAQIGNEYGFRFYNLYPDKDTDIKTAFHIYLYELADYILEHIPAEELDE